MISPRAYIDQQRQQWEAIYQQSGGTDPLAAEHLAVIDEISPAVGDAGLELTVQQCAFVNMMISSIVARHPDERLPLRLQLAIYLTCRV